MIEQHKATIPQRILALDAIFVETPAYQKLQQEFDRLLAHRRTQVASGMVVEMRAIALIGASGSGKTTHVERLIQTTPDLRQPKAGEDLCDVIVVRVPSPATLKSVGRAVLEALGRPLKRERTADAIWEMVRNFLRERKVLFVLLDEAQDIARHQTPKEMQAVINTLKSLMQNKDWPVGLILSGMSSLRAMLNFDPQLARRVFPIELPRLSPVGDVEQVQDMIAFYADAAGYVGPSGPAVVDLASRLIHAADREFGLAIEITIDSLEEAMRSGGTDISHDHFTAAFARRSGCIYGLNPFVADDYERIDVRKLLGDDDDGERDQ